MTVARRRVVWACRVYLAVVAAVWGLLAVAGDRWWPLTPLVYGPRWVIALPLAVLLPLAAWLSPRSLGVLGLAAGLVAGPVTGGTVPLTFERTPPADAPRLRVLTCNLGRERGDPVRFGVQVAATGADVVALQECLAEFPAAVRWPDDWHVRPGPYGLCVASRFPVVGGDELRDEALGGRGAVARWRLLTPAGVVEFVNVHLASPREGLDPLVRHGRTTGLRVSLAERWNESAAVERWLGDPLDPRLVAGDFNMPADSAIFRRHWGRYTDCFATAGWGWGWTKRTRWFGVRIDHVLAGPGWSCRYCALGPDVGSDHRPLIAELVLVGPKL
jgi:vancomycin resistance protein VanJ